MKPSDLTRPMMPALNDIPPDDGLLDLQLMEHGLRQRVLVLDSLEESARHMLRMHAEVVEAAGVFKNDQISNLTGVNPTINGESLDFHKIAIGRLHDAFDSFPAKEIYPCPNCTRPFKSMQGRKRHLKEYHR